MAGTQWPVALSYLKALARDPFALEEPSGGRIGFHCSGLLLQMKTKMNRNLKHETSRSILQRFDDHIDDEKLVLETIEFEDEVSTSNKMREGPQFQAEIPEWTPLPNSMVSNKWITSPLNIDCKYKQEHLIRNSRHEYREGRLVGDKRKIVLLNRKERHQWVDSQSNRLRSELGAVSKVAFSFLSLIDCCKGFGI